MKGNLFMFLLRNLRFERVEIYVDYGSSIILVVPREFIPLLRLIVRMSDCKLNRVK